eukprot:6201609-Pleurochrysis_carterae.AAC.3
MAATYERMPGGFYAYFYADTRQATTLCTFDPSGYGFVSFEDGRPHLTSQRRGGSLVNESGSIEKSWTESKPLKGGAIEIQITPQMLFSFRSRRELAMKLTCMVRPTAAPASSTRLGTPSKGARCVDIPHLHRVRHRVCSAMHAATSSMIDSRKAVLCRDGTLATC